VHRRDEPQRTSSITSGPFGRRRATPPNAEDDTVEEAERAVRRLRSKLTRGVAPTASFRRRRRGGTHRVLVELDADEALALAEHL
jgi:hypothetical protein